MTIWFTSDTHFGHANIIKFVGRPFKSAEEMDEIIIERWNERVRPGDSVYHLGDFALMQKTTAEVEAYVKRLRGQKFLIQGNHDHKRTRKAKGFQEVTPYKEIGVGDQRIILMHYAMKVWNRSHHGSWQLHGHSHGSLPRDFERKQLDVGVDSWDYRPLSFEEVSKEMGRHTFVPVDHHE